MKLNVYTSDFTALGYVKRSKNAQRRTHKHTYLMKHYNGHNASQN